MGSCGLSAALLALLAFHTCSFLCNADLVMVYSVQRHGARNVLPKSSLLAEAESTGGPTLLPQGQRQAYDAGSAFARRYINPSTCTPIQTCLPAPNTGVQYGVLGRPDVGFSNYNTYVNTSALDRTIMSADSFLTGVFPPTNNATNTTFLPDGQQVIPVYSVADTEDWRIRGYTKCPTYQQRLQQWYDSPEFKAKESETATLRGQVQQLAPQLNMSLANWWNVYDAFNVWRTYQVGDATPDIDADTYNKTVDLAMWLETSKMRPNLTGNLLGGGLLADMLTRINAAQQAVSRGSQGYYRLLSVSSHYNTQLGLISALQAGNKQTPYPWQTKIPSLAAVLVFELHASNATTQPTLDKFAVRAVYQDGPKAQYAVLPLPCAEFGDAAEELVGPGSCTLENFLGLAQPQAIVSVGDWCKACNNKDVTACKAARLERQLIEAGLSPSDDGSSASSPASGGGSARASSSPVVTALAVLTSVLGAALLAIGAVWGVRKCKGRRSGRTGASSRRLQDGQDII